MVTGAASGIGLATVRRFVAEGASVTIGDIDGESAAAEAQELGPHACGVQCDVSNEADVRRLFGVAIEQFGHVDIAFANAGIGSFGAIVDTDLVEWMGVLDINLVRPLLTIKYAAKAMHAGGSVIATSSLNAVQASNGMSAYCVSKAGLAMLIEVAALELGSRGVRANAIAPGLVRTPLTDVMWVGTQRCGGLRRERSPQYADNRGGCRQPCDLPGLRRVDFYFGHNATHRQGSTHKAVPGPPGPFHSRECASKLVLKVQA